MEIDLGNIEEMPGDLVDRHKQLIKSFTNCLGGKPKWGDLGVNITGTNSTYDYTIESISFNAEKGERISSVLLTPKSIEKPFPVILCHHGFYSNKDLMLFGEDTNGPSNDGVPLSRMTRFGLAVMAIDGRAHGNRTSEKFKLPWKFGKPTEIPRPSRITDPKAYEESIWEDFEWSNRQAVIDGNSIGALETWDAVRAIDYLETRSDINTQKIGTFGHSRGGDIAWYLSLVDPRVKAICTSGCMQTFEACINFRRDAGAHAWIPNIRNIGSRQELVSALAPRPLLALEGAEDHDPMGEKPMWDALTNVYKVMGVPNNFEYHRLPGGHGNYLKEISSVDQISRWFKQFL